MAQINKPLEYFNTKLYTGNGSTQSITGVGFQPDFVWFKGRSTAYNHVLFDSVRGATKFLQSNTTAVEQTASGLTSFDSDGYSIGVDAGANNSGTTYASWNWKANGAGVSNTDGSITSTVSANTTSGFSIVKYTGTGTNSDTVGHGLGTTPSMIIAKGLDVREWYVQHKTISSGTLNLNTADAVSTSFPSGWINESPTSSTFSFTAGGGGTTNNVNNSGTNFIAYCFAEKKGFSKFGKFTGTSGEEFVYTGFKPAFVILKRTNNTSDWYMFDNKRNTFNLSNKALDANTSDAEATYGSGLDLLSNGFVDKSFLADNGNELIYMAFAEHPLVGTNNIPTTAR